MDHTLSLRSISTFEDLDRNDLLSLSNELQRRAFKAGETIFMQGDPGNAMYIVESGEVRIHLSGNMPQPLSLRSLRPGEFFGELSMFDKQPRSASAIATTDTVLLELRHDAFESLDRHTYASRLQDQPGPGARAAMREVAPPVEHARYDRRRAKDDGVEGDGGNEIEDRPPPVIGGNTQFRIMNLELRMRQEFQILNS